MTYKIHGAYNTKFVEIKLSTDQTVTSASTLVNFNQITGDQNYTCSLVAGGNGRIRLSGGRSYFIQGCITIDRTNNTDSYTAKWYNSSGGLLGVSDGACDTEISKDQVTESLLAQLIVSPSVDTDYDLKTEGAGGDIKNDGSYLFIMEM